jgi:predicted alpha/beta-hydrolase family hydrolase
MPASTRQTEDGWMVNGPERARITLALAHGAGAGMDTDFMNYFAENLAGRAVKVVRFEFPYMVERRQTGKRRPPDRETRLRSAWLEVCKTLATTRLVIGGKSMGGRLATMVADEAKVAGVVCLGYPFHPAGKPDRLRIEHLKELSVPTLIVQGERDALGNRQEVPAYNLPHTIAIHWLSDGDHSLKPRKMSGKTSEQNWSEAVQTIRRFLDSV